MCPRCNREAFGLLLVMPTSYTRRCRECGHDERFALPPLSRKVIYLDQLVISNMMKALNRQHPRHHAAAANPFWRTLFERLDRLVKLHLVICPVSELHWNESMVSKNEDALRRMSEQLSRGVFFAPPHAIALRQLDTAIRAWLAGDKPRYDFDPAQVAEGGLNAWHDRLIISMEGVTPEIFVKGMREFRDDVHAKTTVLYNEVIRTNPNTDFSYWFNRERNACGRAVAESIRLYLERVREIWQGQAVMEYASEGFEQYGTIRQALDDRGIKG